MAANTVSTYTWFPNYNLETATYEEVLSYENMALFDEAYETSFIQGIKNGRLSPTEYAKYDLQDWIYLHELSILFGSCSLREDIDTETTSFLTQKKSSYEELSNKVPLRYSIEPSKNPTDILEMLPATKAIINFFEKTAKEHPLEYLAIAIAPCLTLWGPLANRLAAEVDANAGNAYTFWIDMNKNYWPKSLKEYLKGRQLDRALCTAIYREGLQREIDLFNICTPPNAHE